CQGKSDPNWTLILVLLRYFPVLGVRQLASATPDWLLCPSPPHRPRLAQAPTTRVDPPDGTSFNIVRRQSIPADRPSIDVRWALRRRLPPPSRRRRRPLARGQRKW